MYPGFRLVSVTGSILREWSEKQVERDSQPAFLRCGDRFIKG